jgi:predicted transcriptional regulator of viral defense system
MKPLEAYAELKALGSPVIETKDAATRLHMAPQNAVRLLRDAERAGLVIRLRHGLWLLDLTLDAQAFAPYLTAPYPAYISLWSALYAHDMIEQIPRRTYVASLARTQTISTSRGEFQIHHLMPDVFGGFTEETPGRYLATPEKALFDSAYVRAVRRVSFSTPELTLPPGFEVPDLDSWVARIGSPQVKTLTRRLLDKALVGARQH